MSIDGQTTDQTTIELRSVPEALLGEAVLQLLKDWPEMHTITLARYHGAWSVTGITPLYLVAMEEPNEPRG